MNERQGQPEQPCPAETVCAVCLDVTGSIRQKADKGKWRARTSTMVAIMASATIPIFLGFLEGHLLLRLTPSVLAATIVCISAWTQIERPHERWVLYRRYQRWFEAELLRYRFQIGRYADENTRDREFAEFLAQTQIDLHDEWEGLIPRSTNTHETARWRIPDP